MTKNKIFQCPLNIQMYCTDQCVKQIILENSSTHCKLTKLNITRNHIEIILEINQYLLVFPNKDKMQVKCENSIETKNLMGIFLIKMSSHKIIFDSKLLPFHHTS